MVRILVLYIGNRPQMALFSLVKYYNLLRIDGWFSQLEPPWLGHEDEFRQCLLPFFGPMGQDMRQVEGKQAPTDCEILR